MKIRNLTKLNGIVGSERLDLHSRGQRNSDYRNWTRSNLIKYKSELLVVVAHPWSGYLSGNCFWNESEFVTFVARE